MSPSFIVAFVSLTAVLAMSLTTVGGRWWSAVRSRPGPAMVAIMAVASTFLGGTSFEAAGGLMDPERAARVLILAGLGIYAVLKLAQQPSSFRLAGAGARWMLGYGLLAVGSALYAPEPLIAAYKGAEVTIIVAAFVGVAGQLRTRNDLEWWLNLTGFILLYLAVSVGVGTLLFPDEAFQAGSLLNASEMTRTVRGVLGGINPTSVGGIGAFLMILTVAPLLSRTTRASGAHVVIVLLGILVLILGHSRTAIFGTTAALAVLLIHSRRVGHALVMGGVGALAILLTSAGELVESYIYRGQSEDLFLSMSGRTYYWGIIFDKFLESPIIGHGFYSMRQIFLTSSADNTYLQALLDFGVIGLVVLVAPVIYLITTLYRTRPRVTRGSIDDVLWMQLTGLSIVLVLRSTVGTSFQILHHILPLFLIILLGTAAWHRVFFTHQRTPERSTQAEGPRLPTVN